MTDEYSSELNLTNKLAVYFWKLLYKAVLKRAARQILRGRLFDPEHPKMGRWQESDTRKFIEITWKNVGNLLPVANLNRIPTIGNRHNVYLAVITTAGYRALLDMGVTKTYAQTLLADTGWKIYKWMLKLFAFPFKILYRDPGKRMEKVLKTLMVFPFNAPGRPGYEVDVWTEEDKTYTYWTHCPPQAFVRQVIEQRKDRGDLDFFYHSWCQYDWAGADLLAGDGTRGHYTREHTLSRGDPICDMCWYGRGGLWEPDNKIVKTASENE